MRLPQEIDIAVEGENIQLKGILTLPLNAETIVLFAHGSGSSRLSSRNQFVASVLHQHGVATLLMDLLTENEERIDEITRKLRFDIPLLTKRLLAVTQWCREQPDTHHLKIAYFGASTGAAAALIAAAEEDNKIKAIVSRGGRADLAAPFLAKVIAPTLLIVGGYDTDVLELNRRAYDLLQCEKKLEVVESATHLFEEVGALEQVAALAADWIAKDRA